MADKPKMPFQPAQVGFAATFGDGTQRIALDGGSARYRAGMQNMSDTVQATWVLRGENYAAFNGFVRNARRAGVPFLIDLSLQSHEMVEYEASFVPGSVQLVSRQGAVFTVVAQLEVFALDEFDDATLDYWGSMILFLAVYGSVAAAREIMNLLAKLVNEDLPHA